MTMALKDPWPVKEGEDTQAMQAIIQREKKNNLKNVRSISEN